MCLEISSCRNHPIIDAFTSTYPVCSMVFFSLPCPRNESTFPELEKSCLMPWPVVAPFAGGATVLWTGHGHKNREVHRCTAPDARDSEINGMEWNSTAIRCISFGRPLSALPSTIHIAIRFNHKWQCMRGLLLPLPGYVSLIQIQTKHIYENGIGTVPYPTHKNTFSIRDNCHRTRHRSLCWQSFMHGHTHQMVEI